ncbi:hypothetical protein [Streptomyces sp. NPDC005017]|uniref:hypothetical protein n=1 Tax=Streptomyces sp. NPDC005017 TaxID=3364706 RepID=UPI0036AC3EA4
MALGSNDLLPDEAVQFSKNANAVVNVAEAGLERYGHDQMMWTVGMRGMEAIGGRLHVTNYRLVFNAHPFNRMRGRFSVFLPVITQVRDTSRGIKRQVEISTGTHRFTFVAWGIPALMTAVERLRQPPMTPARVKWLAGTATADHAKIGEGLGPKPGHALSPDMSPMAFIGAVGLAELQELAGRLG